LFRKRILVAILVITLLGVILVVNIPQTRGGQFFLAGWDYPDEYGQGLSTVYIQTNETGSWVTYPDTGRGHAWFSSNDEAYVPLNYSANMALRLSIYARINHTLHDFGPDPSENASARAIMRVGLTLSNRTGIIFALENMTWSGEVYYIGELSPDRWEIGYLDIVEVILQPATIYFLRFTYEIFI
jgi:hypothetical protein